MNEVISTPAVSAKFGRRTAAFRTQQQVVAFVASRGFASGDVAARFAVDVIMHRPAAYRTKTASPTFGDAVTTPIPAELVKTAIHATLCGWAWRQRTHVIKVAEGMLDHATCTERESAALKTAIESLSSHASVLRGRYMQICMEAGLNREAKE